MEVTVPRAREAEMHSSGNRIEGGRKDFKSPFSMLAVSGKVEGVTLYMTETK